MPLLTFGEVIQHIKTKKPMPVYALHGPEPYFIDLLTDAFGNQLLSEEEKAFNLEVFYGKETNINQIVDSLAQYPMGADIKLVIVKNAQELKNIEDLANYVNDPYPSSVLVLSHSGKNLDGRKKLATVIKNKFGLFESKPMYDNQMPAWIKAEVEKSGKTISDQNSALIAEFLGTDLKKIHNELEKTIIAVGESKNITQQHIEDFIGINREFNVFELNAAIFTKNALKAQLVVNYLKDNFNKQPLVVILGSMFNSFIKLYT
ncbi:MAG: DNA polymerase III subunit delta [Saprospiraceae bacterium]|nr:DNA polymerase III subunit delta [Candidatus Brachybacter algidus]